MKRHIFSIFLALTFAFAGLPAVFLPAAAAASRGNAAPPAALPAELQGLDVQDDFIDSVAQHAGSIQTVIGHVVVQHKDSGEAFFAAPGDAVFKNDIIFTLADSRCRVKFTTKDVITMGENANLGLEEYIDNRPRKNKKTIFNMLRGKVMFYAVRLFKYRTTSTMVKTPTAVVGVRGTKFGVDVRKEGDEIASGRPVYLADASGALLINLMSQAISDGIITEVHCFRGELDVTALADDTTQTLADNESRTTTSNQGLNKQPTPADKAQAFQTDTAAPAPGEEGAGQPAAQTPAEGDGVSAAGTGGDTGTTDTTLTDKAENQITIATDQTLTTEGAAIERKGYFSGMLTDQYLSPSLDNVYVSSSRQDFNAAVIKAEGLYAAGYLEGDPDGGFANTNPKLKRVSYDGTLTSDDKLGYPVTKNKLGSNSYLEWGYWYVVQTFLINTYIHDLWHKGYYIAGSPTPDAVAAGISGNYSGSAYGTYYSASGSLPQGIDMTGSFTCDVSSGSVYNFNLNVAGGAQTAAITNGSGTISNGEFAISGTFKLNGTTPAIGGVAFGSLYGPNGEFIGGAWGMKEDSLNGAQGVFQGAKQ